MPDDSPHSLDRALPIRMDPPQPLLPREVLTLIAGALTGGGPATPGLAHATELLIGLRPALPAALARQMVNEAVEDHLGIRRRVPPAALLRALLSPCLPVPAVPEAGLAAEARETAMAGVGG
jgi:hypothetical protein